VNGVAPTEEVDASVRVTAAGSGKK